MKKTVLALTFLAGFFSFPITQAFDVVQSSQHTVAQGKEEEMPKFEHEEANKGIAEFKAIMDKYGPGLRVNDAEKIQEFSTKISAWSVSARNWMAALNPDEQKKLNNFLEITAKKYAPQPPTDIASPPASQ